MLNFTQITGIAASLLMDNIDTDMIIPKQFLKTITRKGLGSRLFYEMRYDEQGMANPDFVLNKAPYNEASILLAGDNFGCGSSREHAPWALADFGIKCIIGESFADIFYNNCFENGILPITLDKKTVALIVDKSIGNKVSVDLSKQEIVVQDLCINFEIDAFRKHCLLNGLDTIGLTIQKQNEIKDFEVKQKISEPWLWNA